MGLDDSSSSSSTGRMLADSSAEGAGPLELSELIHGWDVPTATDISLAWMVAVQVFPLRHPAIDFLLLLAVADDAIGLIIIAAAYSDPAHPVQPQWLPMVVGAMIVCFLLRVLPGFFKLHFQTPWYLYLLFGGVMSWIGLLGTQLHPALAFVFVVPFLPAEDLHGGHAHSPLQLFEHRLKDWVDFGLFFFTLANAGVDMSKGPGPLTGIIVTSLVAGKIVGIFGLAYMAHVFKLVPLPSNMFALDLLMVSAIASIGLTVALFISGEAFPQPVLQSEAKFGALLTGMMGIVCFACGKLPCWLKRRRRMRKPMLTQVVDADMIDEYEDDEEDILNAVTLLLEKSMLLRRRRLGAVGAQIDPIAESRTKSAREKWQRASKTVI